MEPDARKGPKGIYRECFIFLSKIAKMPINDPEKAPIVSALQTPIGPATLPMKAKSSISPSPIPSFPVKNLNRVAIIHKIAYPASAPVTLSNNEIGSRCNAAAIMPTGIANSVTYLLISIVSRSVRMLTIKQEKNIK